MDVKFRTDTAYGNGGHTPAEILAYECFELENIYLIEDLMMLLSRYSIDGQRHPMVKKMKEFYESIDDDSEIQEDEYLLAVPFMQEVIDAFSEVLGFKINYLLWLTDFEIVIDEDMYGYNIENILEDVDAYKTGYNLIEIPCDGNLYAYETKPKPLNKKYIKREMKGECLC